MKVAVLGCSGAMGSFFVNYFLKEGYRVVGSDKRRVGGPPAGFKLASSNPDAVLNADIVLVAVPIRETAKVVGEVLPFLKKGSRLIEIASVKGRTPAELKKILAPRKASLLSLHPLFGPSARSKTFKICVIGGKRDVSAARLLFPKARLIPLSVSEHDRLMAYALSLVHLTNLAFISAVAKGVGEEEFERATPPIASVQLNLSRAVLSQNPSLFSQIQVENPFVGDALSSIIAELEDLKRMIDRDDAVGLEKRFVALAKEFERAKLDKALRGVYSASNS